MKNGSFLIVLIVSFLSSAHRISAQEEQIEKVIGKPHTSLYTDLGFGTFSHLNLNLEVPISSKLSLYGMVGFKHGISLTRKSPQGFFCGIDFHRVSRNKKGPMAGLGITLLPKDAKGYKKILYIEYRNTTADGIRYDAACSGGSNEAEMYTYDAKGQEVSVIFKVTETHHEKWNRYFALGFGYFMRETTKYYDGFPPFVPPSMRSESKMVPLIRLDFGIRVSFLKRTEGN